MYKLPIILLLLLSVAGVSQTPFLPGNYVNLPANNQHNFVRSYTVLKPGMSASDVTSASAGPQDVQLTTQYFDGLGRPIQTVARQGSLNSAAGQTTPVDMVSMSYYDGFGRQPYQYLPYPASTSDGQFKGPNPFQSQQNFYNSGSFDANPIAWQGDSYYYGKTIFEASPLNRVLEQYAPGNSWVGSENAEKRSVKTGYHVNTAADDVRIWSVQDNPTTGEWGSYSSPGAYGVGQLYKTITTDEHGKQVIEFKDKQGLVILKKVQLIATADDGTGAGYDGWICTYYLYDDFGSLRCVVQPEGVLWLRNNSWNLTNTTILGEQCFRYEYDHRRRMIRKKVPGADHVWMVYDSRDRIVLTQDGNMRVGTQKWLYTWYDALNRPTHTGLWPNSGSYATHATAASAIPNGSNTCYPATSTGGLEELTQTYYDDYTWATNTPVSGSFSTVDAAQFSYFTSDNNNTAPYHRKVAYSDQTLGMVTGTRSKVLNSSPSQWLYSRNFYDDDGRIIQVQSTNSSGGLDITTTQYGFAGQPITTVARQVMNGTSTGPQTMVTVTQLSYDALGRMSSTTQKQSHTHINNGTMSAAKTIATQEYDALGQAKKKNLGAKPGTSSPLETISYDYNIRGWLLGANRNYLNAAVISNPGVTNWFGFDLGYDKSYTSAADHSYWRDAQYNGNIRGQTWRSAGDGIQRIYHYKYDAANRLMEANYEQRDGPSSWSNNAMDFAFWTDHTGNTQPVGYDLNGNIKTMGHRGFKPGATTLGDRNIDILNYTYFPNTNRLQKVNDGVSVPQELGDFTDLHTGDDYGYDMNGNLVTDKNKRIDGNTGSYLTSGGNIQYNHLNLPTGLVVKNESGTQKGNITYLYDAAGIKLKKIVFEQSATVRHNGTDYTTQVNTETSYVGGAVYETKSYSNSALSSLQYIHRIQFMAHPEGRMRALYANTAQPNTVTGFAFDYFLKDHLGNVRMVLTEQTDSTGYPTATMETGNAATENLYYTQIEQTRVARPGGFPTPLVANPNNSVAAVGTTGQRVGPGILLKVMAGDTLEILCHSWWTGSMGGATNSDETAMKNTLAAMLGGLMPGASGGKISPGQTGTNGSFFAPGILSFLQQNNPVQSTKPKAHVNWLFLNEQFAYTTGNGSGAEVVDAANTLKFHQRTKAIGNAIIAKQSGYVYIYTSNESSLNVYFDNLKVNHLRGALLEETHYYPFGLTMAGISSKAAGKLENTNEKFQGQPLHDDLGLNWYGFKWRTHDPQIGRFVQIDPLSDEYVHNSTYAFSENKVTSHIELEGLEAVDIRGLVESGIRENSTNVSDASVRKVMQSYDAGVVEGGFRSTKMLKTAGIMALVVLQPEIGIPLAVADISGVPVTPSPQALSSTVAASTVDDLAGLTTIERNAANGAAFEQKVVNGLTREGHWNIVQQVTIKAGNGVKTKLDVASRNTGGEIVLTEAKSSATAPLTKNQNGGFPSIAQSGGVVVGKGKPGFPGGTVIPPTTVNVIRPTYIDNATSRPILPIVLPPNKRN